MTRSRALAGATACLAAAVATALMPVAAIAAAPAPGQASKVAWQPCRQFSDAALKAMMPPEQIPEFKKLWARTECGTLSVPLDYRKPSGRHITIAVTRLKAVDQKHRLGSIALNPGGPGGSGYLMPVEYVMQRSVGIGAKLNQRYDLIGFDPRGVGYSSKLDCAKGAPPPQSGSPVSKADAQKRYDWVVQNNKACAKQDPAFLGGLTTANVARDMDRIRAGIGEKKLSYLGVSWGTWLGALYRDLFPGKVGLMWLDSTALPDFRLDAFFAGRAKATAVDFGRYAAWVAARNSTYGFGTTARQVQAAIVAMEKELNAHPKTFTDLPGRNFDGFIAARLAGQPSLDWPSTAALLKALRDAKSGQPAPALIKQFFGPPPGGGGQPPADLPEQFNTTMNQAVFCNEDTGPRDFGTFWKAYQKDLKQYPATGLLTLPVNMCAGWPLPVQPVRLHHSNAPLVMSAHRYEVPSPYPWSLQMRSAVGGSVLTVDDDVHGSAAGMPTDCAAHITSYFATGRPDNGTCKGLPAPTSTEPQPRPGAQKSFTGLFAQPSGV
ncbi:alpha/beta fold hydrolase [Actinomadura rupiterrae]|uniref:alpha/beta fold hydrolase n=1 Tax=Actinomadura rupiterrae TaxID=559627 RepID=UPI0020A5B445|nr:alpha/beta fold hydrolase [Actinomadura rupiterrae]MCP2342400.1 pimeloyl-ACP methyl ester carboxylesterase [Actinomadura rupiterrae]